MTKKEIKGTISLNFFAIVMMLLLILATVSNIISGKSPDIFFCTFIISAIIYLGFKAVIEVLETTKAM